MPGSADLYAFDMEQWFFAAIVSLFTIAIVTSLYFGSRKHGGIKPYLISYFRQAYTFAKLGLVFLVVWLILALTLVAYAYLTADEQGKAQIREIIQQMTNR